MSRETTSNKSIWNGERERDLVKVWGSYLAINIFPQASRVTPFALSRSYLAWLKLRETQMLGRDNTIITAAVLRFASMY